ncbi:hypothetical protein AK812_SmicGene20417 [Symbiodinium microadriaticum]|uniref:Uncharacterized protein n=1 Tax=Symbiodinium microadriaticum TaxID=2951 RepID=A0A1Q9DQ32_SYMMI|nr:hypothetical protein AK812_SmicGene20417 [Symbiodinium microadriaticum]
MTVDKHYFVNGALATQVAGVGAISGEGPTFVNPSMRHFLRRTGFVLPLYSCMVLELESTNGVDTLQAILVESQGSDMSFIFQN